jgi:hypothetical protein
LRTWLPILRFGGEGDPGSGHHDGARGPCGMVSTVGVSGCHPLAKFEWPARAMLQAQGSQVVLPPPRSLPIVHRDEAHVCACIPGLGAGRPAQHSCAWARFTVTRTLRPKGSRGEQGGAAQYLYPQCSPPKLVAQRVHSSKFMSGYDVIQRVCMKFGGLKEVNNLKSRGKEGEGSKHSKVRWLVM